MTFFVEKDSIIRRIWGKGDTILFIFAGASAEFAFNKAVDWLYFTGRLPGDPLGRLFSTVSYARQIIFSDYNGALAAIDKITAIHKSVEASRADRIPDWAYRDVLFMLIDYSIRSFEVLERELTKKEKAEIFEVFKRVGLRMNIPGLPADHTAWQIARRKHLQQDLVAGKLTTDLYKQYRKHLGFSRYELLKQAQAMVIPETVQQLLMLKKAGLLRPLLRIYKISGKLKLQGFIRNMILPQEYKQQISDLDID
ncbi:oxygenase MpaB family protein [Desertivirga xinjiangensis]|uniref:oxygenase MpaB family protein n=1 Tax=Desertivirga xinjiangensis TaxID=539206 RepID=UPI00210C5092|nr:oxygenase MpaB family protein [Pedobacter xinjiangensis]